jgi:mRNA interferase RelE/StbE
MPLGIKSQSDIISEVEIELTPSARKQAEQLPIKIRIRVHNLIQRLESWPSVSGVKSLRHELKDAFRIRTGDYRVLFTVSGNTIVVFKIDHRRDVYKE